MTDSKPSILAHTIGDTFEPVTREQVSDLALLPRRFDQFVERTEMAFELLTEKIVKPLLAIQESIADVALRVGHLEVRQAATESAQVAHERRIAALESLQPSPVARRKPTRKKARR